MTIGVAVVGSGAWGINHVRVFATEPRCTLRAVVDVDDSRAAQVASLSPDARFYVHLDQALDDVADDAVVISTPAPTHAALACRALSAGKHVLIEKPWCLSTSEGKDIKRAAERYQRVVLLGHLMLFHPAVVKLRELVESGSLGRLHYLHSTRVNLGRLRSDESALWSFGPHDLSMIEFLFQRAPASVSARGQSVLQPNIEDVVFLSTRYATGEMAHIHLSWLNPHKERRLTLVCADKMVEFDDLAVDKLKVYDKGYSRQREFTNFAQYLTIRDGNVQALPLAMDEPLLLEARHFLDCIEHGALPRSDLTSGLRLVATLEAAQKSLKLDGIPVAVEG